MAEIPPSNLLAVWGMVGDLRAEVRSLKILVDELKSDLHRTNNVLQNLQLEHDCFHLHDKKRHSSVD